MAKKMAPVTVININKHGERFDPKDYLVRASDNPQLYAFLNGIGAEGNAQPRKVGR